MADLITTDDLLEMLRPHGLPDIDFYQYWKKYLERTVVINEPITQMIIESAVIPIMEWDKDGSRKPIEIILNTPGGEIYNGFALVDIIENVQTPTTIHILSQACSMGVLIAMAGHNNPNVKTVCHKFSVGLLHSGNAYMEGSLHAVKDMFNFSESYEGKIKEYILTHSNLTEEDYNKIERTEYWMDSDTMLKLGIVDEII